jgi:replicative DNA helicase
MNKTENELLFEKGLPANPDAERFVLGSILLNDSVYLDVVGVLDARDFSLEKHRRIFARMKDLFDRGDRIDRVTLANELNKQGQLQSVDGLSYLVSLDEGLPALSNLDGYIRIVREKSRLRHGILAAQRFINECLQGSDPTQVILGRAERVISDLNAEDDLVTLRTPMEVVTRAGGITAILEPRIRTGVESPFDGLNTFLVARGLTPGQMVTIGARPGKGKSALACQFADHAATNGVGTVLFTLEMADIEITNRMASRRSGVNYMKIRQGWATSDDVKRFGAAYADLTDEETCKLWIDDTTGCTVTAMRSALRRHMARHSVGLVAIDYLQLLETTGGDRRRYEEVSKVSRDIKRMARELKLPVVVLAQLNRESDKGERKPQLTDLRDSGAIEQDSDIVLFLHTRPGQDEHADKIAVDLMIAKQRNGPTGTIALTYVKPITKFFETNLVEPVQQQLPREGNRQDD